MNTKKKILVVDDEPSVTRSLKLNLEAGGQYEVLTENSGAHALMATRKFRPDLILLDVLMPDLEGGDLSVLLQMDPLLHDTPIVFLTALVANSETHGHEKIIGTHAFLAKPVDLDILLQTIAKHIRE